MQRIPNKSSSQQSLVIFILIILIVVAISINAILAWFYSRATKSRIEFLGNILLATQVLNGQTLDFNEYERYPDSIIDRTLRIQKDSQAPNFYLRIRSEIRIDGITTNAITFNINEQDEQYWLPVEYSSNAIWYYCYTDYTSWDLLDEWLPTIHFEFHISPTITQEKLDRIITVILYIDTISVDDYLTEWNYLPDQWPTIVEPPED
ncbi:MAG: hypothetical protein PHC46_00645 [Clostridia bacterium]|nr:hypothetical protein [Clostridia bacterium]